MKKKIIFQKNKRSRYGFAKIYSIKNKKTSLTLERIYIQAKNQSMQLSLNLNKKEIKKDVNDYRDKQEKDKFRKNQNFIRSKRLA